MEGAVAEIGGVSAGGGNDDCRPARGQLRTLLLTYRAIAAAFAAGFICLAGRKLDPARFGYNHDRWSDIGSFLAVAVAVWWGGTKAYARRCRDIALAGERADLPAKQPGNRPAS